MCQNFASDLRDGCHGVPRMEGWRDSIYYHRHPETLGDPAGRRVKYGELKMVPFQQFFTFLRLPESPLKMK